MGWLATRVCTSKAKNLVTVLLSMIVCKKRVLKYQIFV